MEQIRRTEPLKYQRITDWENQIKLHSRSVPSSTILIPVVVHVVYNNSAQNISDAQIISQIQVLNEDFRRMNADRANTPSAFANLAGNANIEFKLARRDPNGNTTNGITRTSTFPQKLFLWKWTMLNSQIWVEIMHGIQDVI